MALYRAMTACLFLFSALTAAPICAAPPWLDGPFRGEAKDILDAVKSLPRVDAAMPASVDVLLDEERIEFTSTSEWRRIWRRVFVIQDAQGVNNERVARAIWTPWFEDRPTIKARVITRDGQAYELDPKTISEAPIPSQQVDVFESRKMVQAPLPAIEVGAIVETETVIATNRPYFPAGVSHEMVFVVQQPTRVVRRVVSAPKNVPLKTKTLSGFPELKRETIDQRVRVAAMAKDVAPPIEVEALRPTASPPLPALVIATGKSWSEVSSEYHELIKDRIDPTFVREIVDSVLGEGKREQLSREEIVNQLLRYVRQRLRYTGLAFGQQSIVPYHPRETLSRRYGDCKDQSVLLISMLKNCGIEADVVLLRTQNGGFVASELPGLNHFDHAIVRVGGEPPIWIDPTANFYPAGLLPHQASGRTCLIVRQTGGKLAQTPEAQSSQNTLRSLVSLEGNENGYVVNTTTQKHTGFFSALQQTSVMQSNANDRTRAGIEANLRRMSHPKTKVFEFRESPLNVLGGPFETSLKYDRAVELVTGNEAAQGVVNFANSVMRLPPALLYGESDRRGSPFARKGPLQLELLFQNSSRREFIAPQGFQHGPLPVDDEIKVGPLTLKNTFRAEAGNHVVVESVLDVGDGRFTADEVNRVREAFRRRAQQPNGWVGVVRFQHPGFRLLSEGKLKEALQMFRDAVRDAPMSADARMQYASALLRTGFVISARKQAARATELAPENARVWEVYGTTLAHDRLGRPFGLGSKWDEAEAAMRKSIALNDSAGFAQAALAQVYFARPNGRRFTNPDNDAIALEIIRKAIDGGAENAALPIDLMEAYLLTDRMNEAYEFSESRVAANANIRGSFWTALAVARSPRAASQQIDANTPDPNTRAQVRALILRNLINSRAYEVAKQFVRLDRVNPNTAAAEAQLQRLKRHSGPFDLTTDPANAIREVARRVLQAEPRAETHAAMFVGGQKEKDNESLTRTWRVFRRLAGSPASAIDGIASTQWTAEAGKGGRVHRVRTPELLEWIVIKVDEQFRVIPSGSDFGALGVVALERLAEDDTATARQLVEWSVERSRGAVNIFDTFAGPAFARYWVLMERMITDETETEIVQLAAALLASTAKSPGDRAVQVLEESLKKESEAVTRTQIARALSDALEKRKDFAGVQRVLEPLAKQYANHEPLSYRYALSLVKQDKNDELDAFDKATMQGDRRNPGVQMARGTQAGIAKDYQKASQASRGSTESWRRTAALYYSFFHEGEDDEWARGAEALPQRTPVYLADGHDAAMPLQIYAYQQARLGDAAKVRETLEMCHQALGQQDVDSRLMVVLGRLAESFELWDVARDAYEAVPQLDPEEPTSYYDLAQLRLKAIQER